MKQISEDGLWSYLSMAVIIGTKGTTIDKVAMAVLERSRSAHTSAVWDVEDDGGSRSDRKNAVRRIAVDHAIRASLEHLLKTYSAPARDELIGQLAEIADYCSRDLDRNYPGVQPRGGVVTGREVLQALREAEQAAVESKETRQPTTEPKKQDWLSACAHLGVIAGEAFETAFKDIVIDRALRDPLMLATADYVAAGVARHYESDIAPLEFEGDVRLARYVIPQLVAQRAFKRELPEPLVDGVRRLLHYRFAPRDPATRDADCVPMLQSAFAMLTKSGRLQPDTAITLFENLDLALDSALETAAERFPNVLSLDLRTSVAIPDYAISPKVNRSICNGGWSSPWCPPPAEIRQACTERLMTTDVVANVFFGGLGELSRPPDELMIALAVGVDNRAEGLRPDFKDTLWQVVLIGEKAARIGLGDRFPESLPSAVTFEDILKRTAQLCDFEIMDMVGEIVETTLGKWIELEVSDPVEQSVVAIEFLECLGMFLAAGLLAEQS